MSASRRALPSSRTPHEVGQDPGPREQALHLATRSSSTELPATFALSVVSNSLLLREGLLTLLSAYVPVALVATYPGQPCASEALPNPSDHIVLLDGGIGRTNAVAWLGYWRAIAAPPPVLILELVNDIELILACVQAGAGGYTLQGASAADVADAIQDVFRGVARCSPEVTAQLFAQLANHAAAPPMSTAPLTPREIEVLNCIAKDMSNQEIADRLVIDIRTVKHHVHNILEKLQLHHRWDAARLAQERGWLHKKL